MIEHNVNAKHNWSQATRPPSAGEMMPDCTLVSMNGKRIRVSDYRGRRNLVLIFCARDNSKEIRSFLRQVFEQRSEFEGQEVQMLVIVLDADEKSEFLLNLPFQVVRDEKGHAHDLAGVAGNEKDFRPVVYVVDRYGEIQHVWRDIDASCANVATILDWVRYINLECPE